MDRKKAELILRSFLFLRIISPRRLIAKCSRSKIASSLKCYHFRTCEGGKPPFNPPFYTLLRKEPALAGGTASLMDSVHTCAGLRPTTPPKASPAFGIRRILSPSDPPVVHARPSAIESSKQASPRQGSPPAPVRRP